MHRETNTRVWERFNLFLCTTHNWSSAENYSETSLKKNQWSCVGLPLVGYEGWGVQVSYIQLYSQGETSSCRLFICTARTCFCWFIIFVKGQGATVPVFNHSTHSLRQQRCFSVTFALHGESLHRVWESCDYLRISSWPDCHFNTSCESISWFYSKYHLKSFLYYLIWAHKMLR